MNLPRGDRALNETGLRCSDTHGFDGDVLLDADRAVRRFKLGVQARILNHQISGRLDRKLPVLVDAHFRSPGNDHGWKIGLVCGCSHHALLRPCRLLLV